MSAATAIYRAVMLEVERRRIALGLPMEKMCEYAGLPDRYYAKALNADAPSGRQAQWATVQIMVEALYPGGFDLEIRAKPGMVITADNLKAKLLQLKATVDPRSQRELMREIGRKGATKGGQARWKKGRARTRARIMRKLAKKRWKIREDRNIGAEKPAPIACQLEVKPLTRFPKAISKSESRASGTSRGAPKPGPGSETLRSPSAEFAGSKAGAPRTSPFRTE